MNWHGARGKKSFDITRMFSVPFTRMLLVLFMNAMGLDFVLDTTRCFLAICSAYFCESRIPSAKNLDFQKHEACSLISTMIPLPQWLVAREGMLPLTSHDKHWPCALVRCLSLFLCTDGATESDKCQRLCCERSCFVTWLSTTCVLRGNVYGMTKEANMQYCP